MTIRPPWAYQAVDCTCETKLPSHASPTEGFTSPLALVDPSCMSSVPLGVTHTKSGGAVALRSLTRVVDGTTFVAKSGIATTAGK